MGVSCDRGCRSSTKFAGNAILSIFLLGVIALVSSLPTERRLDSSYLDQDDLVEMPQEDARAELKGSADSLSHVNRAKRDTMFMRRTIFFNDDNEDEEEDDDDEVLKMDGRGKPETGERSKQFDYRQEDTEPSLSEEKKETQAKKDGEKMADGETKKDPDGSTPTTGVSPNVKFNPLVDFLEQSREFLLHFLDIENLVDILAKGFKYAYGEKFKAVCEKPDTLSKRRAFLDVWLKSAAEENMRSYHIYYFIRLYRPGLFPEASWETDQDQDGDRPQMVPPDDKQSTSCRRHVLHDILQHKTHFIEKMEKSPSLEKFFSEVTRKFDNEVDEYCKAWEQEMKGFSTEQQNVLRNGFWLHSLDYASEEQKFEFVKLLKEGQPQLFSEKPLSELLTKLESTSPNDFCQPEKSSNLQDVSVYRGKANEVTVSGHLYMDYDDAGVKWYGLQVGWQLRKTTDDFEKFTKFTTLPFFITGTWIYKRTTDPVMFSGFEEQEMKDDLTQNCMVLPAIEDGGPHFTAMHDNKDHKAGDVKVTLIGRMNTKRVFTMRYKDVSNTTTTWQLV